MPSVSEHAMLHALTEEVVDAVVDGFGAGSGSPLMMVEFRHAGGALARPGSGALACLPGDYVMFACNAAVPPLAAANATAFARLRDTAASCATDRVYGNFAERTHAPEIVYGEASATRLRAVRTAYDPDGLFAGAQSF
jgi:Berberine and berberine like.